jgi:hypothetical protein
MISNEIVMNNNVVQSLRSITFILVIYSSDKVRNNKVVQLIEIYNFGLGHFFIRICLNNLKLLNLNSKWIYKLKRKKKGKQKTSLGPSVSGLSSLPPPTAPLPFHLG